MRRGTALLLVALLVAVQAEEALRVEDGYEQELQDEDEYEEALQDEDEHKEALKDEDEYEEALQDEDEYEEALKDKARGKECEDEDCPRCPPHPANCSFLVSSGFKYFYSVDGAKLKIDFMDVTPDMTDVSLTCAPGVTLESASLPVLRTQKRFSKYLRVKVNACPAPAGGISRALSRLNITGDLAKLYLNDVPSVPPLHPDLFAGLQNLSNLHLSAEAGLELEPPPGLLEPLKKLWSLHLTDVRMSPAMLDSLLEHLGELKLEQRLPAALTPPSTDLENVSLTAARGSCSALRYLIVTSPRGPGALPAGWLQVRGAARCPLLLDLGLDSCALGGLPAGALRGLTELRQLTVQRCQQLRELPHELFNDTQLLRQLVLANNALEVLPDGIFAPLRELQELDLSGNRLGALGDGAAALAGVRSLTSLETLILEHNPLGDTCANSSRNATLTASELSPLHELRDLSYLSLAHTGASRLCLDWRRDLYTLYRIDFSHNNLTVLKYSDMLWYGRDCNVDLRGNPLRDVIMTSEDYVRAPDDKRLMGRTVLKFNADVVSSCSVYWAGRALREGRIRAKLVGLTCGTAYSLKSLPFDDIPCACPESCACSLDKPYDTFVLRCTALRDPPGLAAVAGVARRFELRLAGATLASLPDALPGSLRVLDLRNASLPAATERQAAALFADERHVLLGGARVACACAGGARPALVRVLVARVPDVRCAEDGRRASDVPPCPRVAEPEPGLRGAWAGALGGLTVATLVLGGAWCAARRGSRLRMKVFLLARGLCAAWTRRDDDDDCRYDVFIWFSRHDFEVVSQIVRELEAGPRPLRVCVHYRDWRAGESILAQIQRSVDRSLRTLVLVSAHAARSVWARAVLREAAARALRDVTPRLVVALLQPAPPPGLDPELAHYVRANTYARWGDVAFWDRLRLALPPGRPRATAAAPPRATATLPPRPGQVLYLDNKHNIS